MTERVILTPPSTLSIVRLLPIPVEQSWEYWTDPELRKQWFCGGQTSDVAGGKIILAFDHRNLSTAGPPEGMDCGEAVTLEGTIRHIEKPTLLTFTWPSGPNVADTMVEVHIHHDSP